MELSQVRGGDREHIVFLLLLYDANVASCFSLNFFNSKKANKGTFKYHITVFYPHMTVF